MYSDLPVRGKKIKARKKHQNVRALTEPVSIAGVGTYTSERIYGSGDTLTTNTIPGLAILVADIFAPPAAMREAEFLTNE